MSGKGSARRPGDTDAYRANHDRIFAPTAHPDVPRAATWRADPPREVIQIAEEVSDHLLRQLLFAPDVAVEEPLRA